MPLVELVPNFSDGRRPDVVDAIRNAIASVPGAVVLDVSSDASHNRTVITAVAPLNRAVDAAFAGIAKARDLIDLTAHQGEHPRIGATDVVPFVPLDGTTMDDCVALARTLGQRVGAELGIPVFLYERAAARDNRRNLADVRRGEFEALRKEMGTNPDRTPDFGPNSVHPTAGATAIGARPFLVAYNVYLGGAENLPVAKEVAKAVRASSGGLPGIKGLGLEVDGQAQVSMNLVDIDVTPLHVAFNAVRDEAAKRGVATTWSEIVGLVPERVLLEAAAHGVQLRDFSPALILERRVRELAPPEAGGSSFVESVASSEPVPGGGSVAAHAGALAAALTEMVAGLTIGKKKYANVEAEMRALAGRAEALRRTLEGLVQRDADAYAAVSAAYKRPKTTDAEITARAEAIEMALLAAAAVPLETARAAAAVAELAAVVAEDGNANAISDAGVAALLAEAAAKGAAYNVRINAQSLSDRPAADALLRETEAVVARASQLARTATDIVEKGL